MTDAPDSKVITAYHLSEYAAANPGLRLVLRPTVANGVIYVGSVDGGLYAFPCALPGTPGCGALSLAATGAPVGTPVVASSTVCVRSGSTIQAFRLP